MGQLYYSSAAVSTTLSTSLAPAASGSTGSVSVASTAGFPSFFPFTLLVDWNTANAEVVTVTQAATGVGPFTYANCIRGDDGTAAVSHGSGATVLHGVSARDFQKHPIVENVLTYGADPTGVADSTTAFQNAINAVNTQGGGVVYVPAGTYKCNTGQISVCTGLRLLGDGWQATQINCTAGGSYLFNLDPSGYSTSVHVENLVISGFTINATGMDIFWGANIVRSMIVDNYLVQNSTGKCIANVQQTTGTNGATYMAECVFANKELVNNGRTTESWHLDFSGTGLRGNDNVWIKGPGKIWTGTGAFWMRTIGDATVLGSKHNTLRDLIFECSGGSGGHVWLQNTSDWLIDNISSEDLSTGVLSNPIILLNAFTTGPGCQGIKIKNYSRRGGSNVSTSVPDIKLDVNATNITIDSPTESSGGTQLTIDLAGASNVSLTGMPTSYTIVNEAAVGLYSTWTPGSTPMPEDLAYAGWAYDPAPMTVGGAALATAGVLWLVKVPLRMAKNVSTIRTHVATAGATLTAGQCFAGLYSSAGTQIATTADQSTAWAGTGIVDMALTGAPFLVNPPFVWVAYLFNGTTGPGLLRGNASTNNLANGNVNASNTRFGSILTGRTTLPASITPGSIARISTTYWAAIF